MTDIKKVENKEKEKIFDPYEIMAIAMIGAQEFIDRTPDISDEKRAVLEKIIQEEQKEGIDQLKNLLKRFNNAVKIAKKFVVDSKDDDYEIEMKVKVPAIKEKGWIKLSAENISISKKEISTLISAASNVRINSTETELEDGYVYGVELVVEFKI